MSSNSRVSRREILKDKWNNLFEEVYEGGNVNESQFTKSYDYDEELYFCKLMCLAISKRLDNMSHQRMRDLHSDFDNCRLKNDDIFNIKDVSNNEKPKLSLLDFGNENDNIFKTPEKKLPSPESSQTRESSITKTSPIITKSKKEKNDDMIIDQNEEMDIPSSPSLLHTNNSIRNNANNDEFEPKPKKVYIKNKINQTEIGKNFDKVPKQWSPKYKYQPERPIRNKVERAKLPGWDCDECEKYYGAMKDKLGEEEYKKIRDKCSRHRAKYRAEKNTPDLYWQTDFPSTAECIRRGYLKTDSYPTQYTQKTQID